MLDEPDFETVLPAAGLTITDVGPTTYQLTHEAGSRSVLPARDSCLLAAKTFP
jgi:hypothetical protein